MENESAEAKKKRLEASRQRSNEAGRNNFRTWTQANPGKSALRHGLYAALGGALATETKLELEAFQKSLEVELGHTPNAIEAALIRSARVSFSIVLLGQRYIEQTGAHGRRRVALGSLFSVISNHQAQMLRNLHALGFKKARGKPVAPTTAELIAMYDRKPSQSEGNDKQ